MCFYAEQKKQKFDCQLQSSAEIVVDGFEDEKGNDV